MANIETTKQERSARATHLSLASKKSLPPYLFLRDGRFYFKRKVPRGMEDAFPQARGGQVWKSLGTGFLEQARILLAAERSEFELVVAKARKERATSRAAAATPSGPCGPLAQFSSARDGAPFSGQPAAPDTPVTSLKPDAAAPPATLAKAKKGPRLTMRHLLEAWKITQSRHRTIHTFESTVDDFHALCGALVAEDITRQHARTYRDSLVERNLCDATIANRLGFLGTLFRFGQVELIEHVLGNPFERIPVHGGKRMRVEKDRRAYTVAELNTIFSSKLYTTGYRPHGQVGEAAYWVPLLGPFVGARIEEVAQLRVEDIASVNGTWCILICDVGEDQRIKTIGSYRRVPVHDMLVGCGFLKFVETQRSAGHERLFPSLTNDNANKTWSNALGKWYARYLDDLGLSDPRLDYHSYRYSFRQQCTLCGIENETRDALTGHWVGRRDAGRTYLRAEERQYPFPKLVTAMAQLRYDELNLTHLLCVTS